MCHCHVVACLHHHTLLGIIMAWARWFAVGCLYTASGALYVCRWCRRRRHAVVRLHHRHCYFGMCRRHRHCCTVGCLRRTVGRRGSLSWPCPIAALSCHCAQSLPSCCCAPSSLSCCCVPSWPSVVRGVRALRDWRWVPVCNTWAIGPIDGVLGATAHPVHSGCYCSYHGVLSSLSSVTHCMMPGPYGPVGSRGGWCWLPRIAVAVGGSRHAGIC